MILETITLDSALCMTLLDQTRHYFGGYYHVKVLVFCDVPVRQSYFEDVAEYNDVVTLLGESVRFERILEKMAVPESGIESVRNQLTQTFHETSGSYLSVPDFAARFIRSEYQKRAKKPTSVRTPRG
ncbi:MAG: hypothetical protein A2076_06195 [Geobacteraceae bacterium GWC2_53_11]|nr:MAG: hypothetical protein A2076_06195 [Geobacteraceae bacterium GWC2_53_11]